MNKCKESKKVKLSIGFKPLLKEWASSEVAFLSLGLPDIHPLPVSSHSKPWVNHRGAQLNRSTALVSLRWRVPGSQPQQVPGRAGVPTLYRAAVREFT